MVRILSRAEIERTVADLDLIAVMERAFSAYSSGHAKVAAVGHLDFGDHGDVCVKSGFLVGGDRFVVKVAGGFSGNPARGLSSSQGLMIVCSSRTGVTEAILQDEGWLTDMRTGAAGGVVAKWLAPTDVQQIAILGTGIQARIQARFVSDITGCKTIGLWGRTADKVDTCASDLTARGLHVQVHSQVEDAVRDATVIVTTTSSHSPILPADAVRNDALIIAMGSDGAGKQELEPALFGRATLVVADSIDQCTAFGEISHAIQAGSVRREELIELGNVIAAGVDQGRASADRMVIADLTGVAVQDVLAACAVLDHVAPSSPTDGA